MYIPFFKRFKDKECNFNTIIWGNVHGSFLDLLKLLESFLTPIAILVFWVILCSSLVYSMITSLLLICFL